MNTKSSNEYKDQGVDQTIRELQVDPETGLSSTEVQARLQRSVSGMIL